MGAPWRGEDVEDLKREFRTEQIKDHLLHFFPEIKESDHWKSQVHVRAGTLATPSPHSTSPSAGLLAAYTYPAMLHLHS